MGEGLESRQRLSAAPQGAGPAGSADGTLGGDAMQDVEPEIPDSKKPRIEGIADVGGEHPEDRDLLGGEGHDWDDTFDCKIGEALGPLLVDVVRKEELAFMKKICLYDEVSIDECWEAIGKGPVSTMWVDVNKGTSSHPDVRCRLVARDFKPRGERDRVDLFAAMPPLEAKKLLFKMAVSTEPELRGGRWERPQLMFVDIKTAHLTGKVPDGEKAYIELPQGAARPGVCGRLRRWLYGMRRRRAKNKNQKNTKKAKKKQTIRRNSPWSG